jgi:hypothetical protein
MRRHLGNWDLWPFEDVKPHGVIKGFTQRHKVRKDPRAKKAFYFAFLCLLCVSAFNSRYNCFREKASISASRAFTRSAEGASA